MSDNPKHQLHSLDIPDELFSFDPCEPESEFDNLEEPDDPWANYDPVCQICGEYLDDNAKDFLCLTCYEQERGYN